jgi:hypothetical protein
MDAAVLACCQELLLGEMDDTLRKVKGFQLARLVDSGIIQAIPTMTTMLSLTSVSYRLARGIMGCLVRPLMRIMLDICSIYATLHA